MSEEGYLQNKIRELNEKIIKLEEKQKSLEIRYNKVKNFYDNELENSFKNIEKINQTRMEIKDLPRLIVKYIRENVDEVIIKNFRIQWKEIEKEISHIFKVQNEINAGVFKHMAKRYMTDNLQLESEVGVLRNVLIHNNIITAEEYKFQVKGYKKMVKSEVKNDLGFTMKVDKVDKKTLEKIKNE